MEYKTIATERRKDGKIGVIALNNPPVNAWSNQFIDDLGACLTEFKNDPDMNVVIIKSNCKHFSAGIDFGEILNKSSDAILDFFKKCMSIRPLMQSMPQITIAQVHGTAAAYGTHLSWFCDLAVASEDAKFGAPPINVGLG